MTDIATPEEEDTAALEPWEKVAVLSQESDPGAVADFVQSLTPGEQRLTLSRLETREQAELISNLPSDAAAEVVAHLTEVQAVELLEKIAPEIAADIVEELPEEMGVSLLQEMASEESEAVLSGIDSDEEAGQLRELLSYDDNTAGGLMSHLVVTVAESATVKEVIEDLEKFGEEHEGSFVHYVYVTDGEGRLAGLLSMTDLLLKRKSAAAGTVMIREPESVNVNDSLDSLKSMFEEHGFISMPVIDGGLRGVVTRKRVREEAAEQQKEDYLHASGIVGGEELRSMPMILRSRRRLAWLAPNIVLNLVAASIIAFYEDTLQAVIALAVFLPIISDMSGCSGNQAVAVSIRELTLGLIRPNEFLRIVWKEGLLGILNGFVLGLLLGTIAFLWKDNIWLGAVVGGALFLNTLLSVLLGGMVPLLLKKFRVDPALASGPILTTCTDMCGFFLVLNLASAVLSRLV